VGRENSSSVQLQADHHPLEYTGAFASQTEHRLHLMHRKSYEDAAKLTTGLSTLDLGCNNGWGTHLLAGTAKEVIGLDVSHVADARQRYGSVDFRLYDGHHLPFSDERFDVVVSLQVIEHIDDPKKYLAEIARVLIPGGRAIFTTPNATVRLDPGMAPWNEFHVREFSATDLHGTLSPFFSTVSITGMFATDVLYQTELKRLEEVKSAARAATRGNAGQRRTIREQAKAVLKVLLPDAGVSLLRKLRGSMGDTELDGTVFQHYSTKDFFYRSEELDRALDLMAICDGPRKM